MKKKGILRLTYKLLEQEFCNEGERIKVAFSDFEDRRGSYSECINVVLEGDSDRLCSVEEGDIIPWIDHK